MRTSIKRKKHIETSTNMNKHNWLSKIDIIENGKESKEENTNNDRFNALADDVVA